MDAAHRPAGGETSGTSSPAAKPVDSEGSGGSEAPAPDQIRAEVRKALSAWVAAQNDGDFKAYMAAYDHDSFEGVKRTRDGKARKMDFSAWESDRERMFEKGKQQVAADEPAIELLDDGVTEVKFVQRWRSRSYADHGQKVLRFKRAENGAHKIIFEEMLTSDAGWESSAKVEVIDATDLKSPISVSLAWVPSKQDPELPELELSLRGAGGKSHNKRVFSLSDGAQWDSGPIAKPGAIEPARKGGVLFDDGFYFAGGGDYFRVARDGTGIVFKHRITDEGSEDVPPHEGAYEERARFELAADAEVKAVE